MKYLLGLDKYQAGPGYNFEAVSWWSQESLSTFPTLSHSAPSTNCLLPHSLTPENSSDSLLLVPICTHASLCLRCPFPDICLAFLDTPSNLPPEYLLSVVNMPPGWLWSDVHPSLQLSFSLSCVSCTIFNF